MAESDNHRGKSSITAGPPDAPRSVILFHGYTGSPAEFGNLPDIIAEKVGAHVFVPLLPGHGTRVEDLLPLTFEDFLRAAYMHTETMQQKGRPFAIGGHSFGGHLATFAAAKANPSALFTSVLPYQLRFPLSSRITQKLSLLKPLWKKRLPPEELEIRKGWFYYPSMPSKGLAFVAEANRRLPEVLPHITCPTFVIHARHDRLAYPESGTAILAQTSSRVKESLVVENGRHGMFYGSGQDKVVERIIDFLSRAFGTGHEN